MRKGKRNFRPLGVLLSLVMMIAMMMVPSMSARAEDSGVDAFVRRCYQVTLNREPDEGGFADWTSQLNNGVSCGSYVAYGFVFSDEYTNAGKDNAAFVTDMYTLFMGREPDEAGFNDWKGQLDAGADRTTVFAGFANSVEFYNLCTSYGVTAGVYNAEYGRDQLNNVNMFVARMYRICLNRLGDQAGQADWTNRLLKGELTGIECAQGFVFSEEYINLGLSNYNYVQNLYRVFMGREADEDGFVDWTDKMIAGYTRDEVFAGFANSVEFQNICDSYGIIRGDYTPTDVHTESASDSDDEEHGWHEVKKTDPKGRSYVYEYGANPDSYDKYTVYAADGRLLGVMFERLYDEEGNNIGSINREFDDDGKMIYYNYRKRTVEVDNGTERVVLETSLDESGQETGSTRSYYMIQNGKDLQTKEVIYDENRKVKTTWEYKYNADGFKTWMASYHGEENRISQAVEYKYNENGKKLEESETHYRSDGTTIAFASTYKYDYNDAGKMTRVTNYDTEGKEIKHTDYFYNNKGLLIKYASYRPDSNEPTDYTEYERDLRGNKVKATMIDRGKIRYVDTFAFDDYDNRIKDTFLYADGTEEVTTYVYEKY